MCERCLQRSRPRTLRVRDDLYAAREMAANTTAAHITRARRFVCCTGCARRRRCPRLNNRGPHAPAKSQTGTPKLELRAHKKKPLRRLAGAGAIYCWRGDERALERAQERLQIAPLPVGEVDVEAVLVEVDHLADV